MRKGIILQERDFQVLRSVYESTVISFGQLRTRHFGPTNIQTASNRLGRLAKGGLIKSYRLGLVIYQGVPRQVNRVYTLAPLGIQTLAAKYPDLVQRFDPVPLQSYSLMHDLILNDVHLELKKENPNLRIVNTKNLKILPTRMDQIPDLAMEGENGELSGAIELELSMKSAKRYREIITNYRLSSRWKKVLFICANDAIESKIRSMISGGGGSFGKFRFRFLSELLKTPGQSGIYSDSTQNLKTA